MFNWADNGLAEWVKIFKHLPSCHKTRVEPSPEVERARGWSVNKRASLWKPELATEALLGEGFLFLLFLIHSLVLFPRLLEEHFKPNVDDHKPGKC